VFVDRDLFHVNHFFLDDFGVLFVGLSVVIEMEAVPECHFWLHSIERAYGYPDLHLARYGMMVPQVYTLVEQCTELVFHRRLGIGVAAS
jgi:hypothetical protein